MDSARAKRIVLAAWAGYAAMVTIKQIINPAERGLPPPRMYLASGVLFSMFFLAAGPLKTLPAVLAIGVDVAVLFNPYVKGSTDNSLVQQLAGFVDTIAGAQPAPGPQDASGIGTPSASSSDFPGETH